MKYKKIAYLLHLLIAVCCAWLLANDASAAASQPNKAQVAALASVKYSLETITDLEKRQILTPATAKEQRDYYLTMAQIALGKPVGAVSLATLIEQSAAAEQAKPGFWTKIAGLVTLTNIMLVLACIFIVVGAGLLFARYLLPILVFIPAEVYETLIYAACLGALAAGTLVSADMAPFVALPGCLGLVGAVALTFTIHRDFLAKSNKTCLSSLMLTLVWGATALYYQSQIIGFFTVLAFVSAVGFSVAITPLCYCIGYEDKENVPRGTMAALLVLALNVVARTCGVELGAFQVFSVGSLYIGGFVYFVGLLIMSSSLYSKRDYALHQMITIVSGVAALVIGSVWGMTELRGIGGTFFFLYLLEKYVEMVKSVHFAWGVSGAGLLLYGSAVIMRHYPSYFFSLS